MSLSVFLPACMSAWLYLPCFPNHNSKPYSNPNPNPSPSNPNPNSNPNPSCLASLTTELWRRKTVLCVWIAVSLVYVPLLGLVIAFPFLCLRVCVCVWRDSVASIGNTTFFFRSYRDETRRHSSQHMSKQQAGRQTDTRVPAQDWPMMAMGITRKIICKYIKIFILHRNNKHKRHRVTA